MPIWRAACSESPNESYQQLADEVNKEYPHTKVVGYPYHIGTEEDTLGLIDDVLNSWGRSAPDYISASNVPVAYSIVRLDVWVTSSGLLGPPSIQDTTPDDLRKCFEANSMAPFFALKYAPPAMAKTTPKGNYPNAAPKDIAYGSIIVVASVASTYGGEQSEDVVVDPEVRWQR